MQQKENLPFDDIVVDNYDLIDMFEFVVVLMV